MRKVSNKKALRHLSVNMLKAGKKKNVAVIIAVVLTAVMFTTLFSVGASMVESAQRSTMRQVGGSDMAGFKYGREEDYETLKADPAVKNISYRTTVGYLQENVLKDMVVEVYYATDENAKSMFSYPTTGRMPEKIGEIALSDMALEKLGITPKLGQTITLHVQVDEEVLQREFTLVGYWKGDPVARSQMAYISREEQELVAPEPSVSYYESDRMSMTGYRSIDFDFASSFHIEKQVEELFARNGYDKNIHSYGVNWAYASSGVDIEGVVLGVGLLGLILLAGYLIIYNIFYISVVADIQQYGLLKTIGTTGKQLRYLVNRQALLLSAMGSPVGLVVGTLLARKAFPLILRNSNISEVDMVFSIHPMIYVLSVMFVFLTVLLGCRKSGKMASKVSPIEAVRYEEQGTGRKKKTKKISVFSMALCNCKRERKKVMVVVLSLTLSILLVSGIYAVVIGLDADKYVSSSIIGDVNISHAALKNVTMSVDRTTVVTENDRKAISSVAGVEKISNVYCDVLARVTLNEQHVELVDSFIQKADTLLAGPEREYMTEELKLYRDSRYLSYDCYGIDSALLEHVSVREGIIEPEKWETGEYAIVYSYQLVDRTAEDEFVAMFSVGEQIEVEAQNGKKKKYTVLAIGELPYALTTQSYGSFSGSIVLPAEEYVSLEENKDAILSVLELKDSKDEGCYRELEERISRTDSLIMTSKKTYLDEFDTFIQSIGIVGGALAAILAVIGVMNFANTFITGIWKRARELAIMQAVGLTRKQMVQMLIMEGVLQGILTIGTSLFLHVVLGGMLIERIAGAIWFFEYEFTMLPIVACAPFILLVVILVPFFVNRSLDKKSVVERMRIS